MRALRGAGPLRLRREKRARNRSDMGCVGSSNRSHRNFSMSDADTPSTKEPMSGRCRSVGGPLRSGLETTRIEV